MLIRCSRCGSDSVRWSKRRGMIEKALSVLVRPYRCTDCYHRFFPLVQTVQANLQSREDAKSQQSKGNLYPARTSEWQPDFIDKERRITTASAARS
jgi:hypothetical protein